MVMIMTDETLIKSFQEYFHNEDTHNFTVLDFVGAFGSPLMALGYAKLFWPEFIEFKGMVFFAEDFDSDMQKRVTDMLEQDNLAANEIEQSFNLFEVPSIFFAQYAGDTDEEQDEDLAEILARMWKCKLETDFPEKDFSVRVLSPEESGGEVAVSFSQE